MRVYYAKSKMPDGTQPTNRDHLQKVSDLAEQFGQSIDMENPAKVAGLFHDFGKYTDYFQDILIRRRQAGDHALGGAIMLYQKAAKNKAYHPIVEAIAGHHNGLKEYSEVEKYVQGWLNSEDTSTPSQKNNTIETKLDFIKARNAFQNDFPTFRFPKMNCPTFKKVEENLEKMLFTRMLFSCLVDADYSISASDEDKSYLDNSENTDFDAKELLKRLYDFKNSIACQSTANSQVNQLREQVFEQCGAAGEQEPGLFTLTAPTGTGKTLALLHFALRHCEKWNKKRIIVVLPFLTLTEQNAAVYRSMIPDLLEDHSQSNLDDTQRIFSERWSTPFIVTTSVRFFETLFAQKPTDCRKLHNITNSVVIFDEAQSLPADLTTATLKAVNELCQRYKTTMVFSTATQPDFASIPEMKGDWCPTEILPENQELYNALRRTKVEWRLDMETPLENIADEMFAQKSVCAIVNLRKHARKLYHLLEERCSQDELFYLTTDLCTAHRRKIVAKINQRLKDGLPCRLVATQCIEAGVDFDFDVLYRALAPLDSIIQAAGRCNRNGRLPNGGQVIVFVPEGNDGDIYPGKQYGNAAKDVKIVASRHEIDIHNPQHIKEYYELLFYDALDKKELREAIEKGSFEDVDKAYQLIDNHGVQVIVPYGGKLELYHELEQEGKKNGVTPWLLKRAAPIMVNVSFGKLNELDTYAEPLNYPPQRANGYSSKKSNVYVLRPQHSDLYSKEMGLQFPEKVELDVFW